jgi:hypothetical protein
MYHLSHSCEPQSVRVFVFLQELLGVNCTPSWPEKGLIMVHFTSTVVLISIQQAMLEHIGILMT